MADPKKSTALSARAPAFVPTVNWNAGNVKPIRTNLRGSRPSTTSQPKAPLILSPDYSPTSASTPQSEKEQPSSTRSVDASPATAESNVQLPASLVNSGSEAFDPTSTEHQSSSEDAAKAPMATPRPKPAGARKAAGSPPATATKEGRRLLVGNVPNDATEEDIREFFKGFRIESIALSSSKASRPWAYAFVVTSSAAEAQAAVSKLAGQTLRDHEISVELPRSPKYYKSITDISAPQASSTEASRAERGQQVPWTEVNANPTANLNAAKAGKTATIQEIPPQKSPTDGSGSSPEAAAKDAENFIKKEEVPARLRALSLEEQNQRPQVKVQNENLDRGSIAASSSNEDDSGVILNLVSRAQTQSVDLEEGELSDAPSINDANAPEGQPEPPRNPRKRDYDSTIDDALSDSSEEHLEEEDSGVNGYADSGGNDSEGDVGHDDGGRDDEDQGEEGEILEGSEQDEDAMVVEYANADQEPKREDDQSPAQVLETPLSPIASSPEPSPQLGLDPANGPEVLKDLSIPELRIQVCYFYVGRDPKTIPESDPVHCTICARSGHVQKYCPSATCSICGAFKDHFSHSCPDNQRCSRCRGRHPLAACTLKLKPDNLKLTCDLCQEDGHEEGDCELQWRSSGAMWKKPLPALSVSRFCYECGAAGHLGNDCSQRRPGKMMGSSMWSARGLPNPMQPIKNLTTHNTAPRPASEKAKAIIQQKAARAAGKAKNQGKGRMSDPIDLDYSDDQGRGGLLDSRRGPAHPLPRKPQNKGNISIAPVTSNSIPRRPGQGSQALPNPPGRRDTYDHRMPQQQQQQQQPQYYDYREDQQRREAESYRPGFQAAPPTTRRRSRSPPRKRTTGNSNSNSNTSFMGRSNGMESYRPYNTAGQGRDRGEFSVKGRAGGR